MPSGAFALGVVWLVLGVVAAVGAVRVWPERAAYVSAPECAGAATEDCVRDVDATAEAPYRNVSRRTGRLVVEVVVDGPDAAYVRSGSTTLRIPAPGAVEPLVHEDMRVRIRVWDGQVVRLILPSGESAETYRSPAVQWPVRAASTSQLLAFAVAGLLIGWYRRLDRTAIAAVSVAAGAGAVNVAVRLHGWYDLPRPLALFAGTAAVVAAVLAAVSRWRAGRAARRGRPGNRPGRPARGAT